jgi:hypothetical protein
MRIVLSAAGVDTVKVDTEVSLTPPATYRPFKNDRIGPNRIKTRGKRGYCSGQSCYSRRFVSPILVRPVREQLEHDRIIRLLQTKFRRRFDVGINPGAEQNTAIGTGQSAVYPDVVLISQQRSKKIDTIIEVETVESVNHLEALAEWVAFGRLRSTFHLYVPATMVEVAKRLCADHNILVAEIHTYHTVGDELRFVPVYRAPSDGRPRVAAPIVKKSVARPASGRPKKSKPARAGGSKKTSRKTTSRSPKRK